MIITIQSIHFDADAKLLEQVEDKMKHLEKLIHNKDVEAKVILKLEHVSHVQDKIIEVIINLPGQPIVAKSTKKSFEEALIDVVATLKNQLLRHKEKMQEKH
jgi:putative sigma-54 modulation protein